MYYAIIRHLNKRGTLWLRILVKDLKCESKHRE